jgi:AraC-like DNA-binding protein
MSASLPLAAFCQFKSNDFAAMHDRLCSVLKPHRLRRLSSVPVSGIICRASLKRITLNLMRIGPAVEVLPGAIEHFYLVQIPIVGAVDISQGEDRVRCAGATAAVLSPGEKLRLRWSDNCTQLIVQIPRNAIETRLARRSGGKRAAPRFAPAFDLASSSGREWRALLDFVMRSLDDSGIFSRNPLNADLEDLLLSSLLAVQPHDGAGELAAEHGAVPYYVLRAERQMRERMPFDVTIAELAESAGVSRRTLHDGFRRFRSSTPMRELTAMRLAAARRRLSGGEPELTVSRAATEAGFTRLGHFSGLYRETFGELPSATLQRALRRSVN